MADPATRLTRIYLAVVATGLVLFVYGAPYAWEWIMTEEAE